MGVKTVKIITILELIIFILIFISGCKTNSLPTKQARLEYTIGGCIEEKEFTRSSKVESPKVYVKGNFLILKHDFDYVCCANLTLYETIKNNSITIIEENVGGYCRCMCEYNVEAKLGPLTKGVYKIKVYGIKYQNMEPELLTEQEAII